MASLASSLMASAAAAALPKKGKKKVAGDAAPSVDKTLETAVEKSLATPKKARKSAKAAAAAPPAPEPAPAPVAVAAVAAAVAAPKAKKEKKKKAAAPVVATASAVPPAVELKAQHRRRSGTLASQRMRAELRSNKMALRAKPFRELVRTIILDTYGPKGAAVSHHVKPAAFRKLQIATEAHIVALFTAGRFLSDYSHTKTVTVKNFLMSRAMHKVLAAHPFLETIAPTPGR